jgi:glycosyltransferase involved in cell wall biosynthesis
MLKEFFRPPSLRWQDWRFKAGVEWPLRFSLRAASYVVTGTETMAGYYSRQFGLNPSRILVVPNDVDVEAFLGQGEARSGMQYHDSVVLYVGQVDQANGADRLPIIAESVCRRVPRARFLVVGGGSLYAWLGREIEARGLVSRVTLLGRVPNSQVARYYAQADLFVLPAVAEGMPRVLLECMAAGVPFVATAVGGVPDLATPLQRRWLVAPDDLETFADRVVELLGHPENRRNLREEGQRRIRDFSRERICRLFVQQIVGMPALAQPAGDPSIPGAKSETHEREAPEPARR